MYNNKKINYSILLKSATRVRERSYSPYSKLKIGAAVLTKTGKVFTGTNVENASYGLTICAERVAVFNAVTAGEKEIIAVAIAGPKGKPVPPCGACRQVLSEFGCDVSILFPAKNGKYIEKKLSELLPDSFGK
ncbi:MAG: cytidine deaminase [Elusimicrobiota bacterium]